MRQFKVEPRALTVDEHNSFIDELLTSAIVGFITAKRIQWKEKFDRQSPRGGRARFHSRSDRSAETNSVEVLITPIRPSNLEGIRVQLLKFSDAFDRRPTAGETQAPQSVVYLISRLRIR